MAKPKTLTPEQMLAMLPEWATGDKRLMAVLKEHASPPAALEHYGVEKFQAGDVDLAVKAFTVATVLAPREAIYQNNLGVALNASGDGKGAIAAFRKSLRIDDNQPQIWLNLAHTAKPLGRAEEAREALLAAAKYTETASEALTTLGNWQLEQGDYSQAAEVLNRAIRAGEANAAAHAALGATLFQQGVEGEAAAHYAEAAKLKPDEAGYADNASFLAMLHGVALGKGEAAVAAYARPLQDDAVLISAFNRGLVYFNSFDRSAAAKLLLDEWLQYYPDDPDALYFQLIARGKKPTRAPPAYVASYFDRLAPTMDDKFLAAIDYRVPSAMAELFAAAAKDGWRGDVLDAGCGTGALGRALKPFAKTLTGVDLSPLMVTEARAAKLYDNVAHADFLTWLQGAEQKFDLVAAADSLIYFGALELVFAAARLALRPQGWLMINVETLPEGGPYAVTSSGRFKHAPAYVISAAQKGFKLVQRKDIALRLQAGKPVAGAVFLFQKV